MIQKIKYTLIIVALILACQLKAQSPVNYVLERSLLEKQTNETKVFETKGLQTISYFDGLGRPIQQVAMNQSPSGSDIVQIIDYDDFGRQAVNYMPYTQADNNGAFIPTETAIADYKDFYNTVNDNAFQGEGIENFTSITDYDGSPLNRPVEQGAVGKDWQAIIGNDEGAHSVKFTYGTNGSDIKRWEITSEELNSSAYNELTNYDPSSLYVNTTTDENNHPTKEYKNLQGQVVLTESFDGSTPLRTYYIYDDFGLLRCVVPPKAGGTVNDKYCYFYRYDHRKRMVEKKIPGAEAIYMVYDSRDRLILSQDGNMRGKNQWMATLYDNLNRPNKTGIYESQDSRETLADHLDISKGGNIDYIKNLGIDELSQTFYDNYTGLSGYNYINPNKEGFETSENTAVKGQITYTRTRYDDDGIQWLFTVNYYDDKYRVIQTIAGNHLGGRDVVSNRYDFVGKVMETRQVHTVDTETETIVKEFVYDHAGRLLETKMDVGGTGLKTVSTNDYNELGQLITKNTHNAFGEADFIKTSHDYNIRGWMTTMGNKDKNEANLFTLGLGYNQGDKPQYNGNISAMNWSSLKQAEKTYNFEYDAVNRLKVANFTGSPNEDYSTSYSYDFNGNIEHLSRKGFVEGGGFPVIDNLNYKYQGNRLIGVNDDNTPVAQNHGFTDNGLFSQITNVDDTTKHEYFYDPNGNLTADYNKQIEAVRYNQLNLPILVDLGNNNQIEYLYDAAGIKLQQRVYKQGNLEKVTDYVGNFVYENSSLKFIITDEGRMLPREEGTGYDYEYFIKDHLGNNRVTVADQNNDGIAEVMQEDHYYPFGMAMEGMSYQNPLQQALNKYLYNGKELQDDLGLGWYDYGARFYDAQLGRWHNLDPMLEKYPNWTPYNYVFNNPLVFIDPMGMSPESDKETDDILGLSKKLNEEFKAWLESQTNSENGNNSSASSNSSNSQSVSNNSSSNTGNGGGWYIVNGQLRYIKNGENIPEGAIYVPWDDKQKAWDIINANIKGIDPLGPIGIGITGELVVPRMGFLPSWGYGGSFGFIADNKGLGFYSTKKRPIGDHWWSLSIAPEFFYIRGTTKPASIFTPEGKGYSTGAGFGVLGLEIGTDQSGTLLKRVGYYQIAISGLGKGLDANLVKWKSNTTIIPLFYPQ